MTEDNVVYLLQEPTSEKDLSSAAKQGRIVPIIGAEEKPSQNIQATIDKLEEYLRNYDPAKDSICFAGGDPIVEFLAGVVLERIGVSEVVHLIWNRERDHRGNRTGSGFYLPKKIQIYKGE